MNDMAGGRCCAFQLFDKAAAHDEHVVVGLYQRALCSGFGAGGLNARK